MGATSDLILAHDLGTSGNKATLFSADGDILASEFQSYESFYGPNGEAEQEPDDWWRAVIDTTRRLLAGTWRKDSTGSAPDRGKKAAGRIAAVGFSGHMMGCLAVDADGRALGRSWLHSDTRSAKQAREIARRMGAERYYRLTGNPPDPHYPLSKMMWLKEYRPDIYRQARWFLQSKDYIAARLTGRFGVTDHSDASLYGAYDMAAREWADEVLEAAGIERGRMPEILESSAQVGCVTREAAEATGLAVGTPVIIGGGDGACAAVGAGAIEPGDAYNYIGSTSWISATTEEPVLDPKMRLFVIHGLEPQRYGVIGTVQCAGAAYEWAADTLCPEESEGAEKQGISRFKLMDDLARQAPPGCDGLVFLPYLMGERAPIWDPHARGVFFGLSIAHTRAHMIRAVLEGVGYALRSIVDIIEENGTKIGSVTLIGGGAEGLLWPEILACILARPIRTPKRPREATSYGAATAAGVGVGLFDDFRAARKLIRTANEHIPNPQSTTAYRRAYEVFRDLYPALKPLFAATKWAD